MGQLGSNRLGLPESVVDYLMWYHLGRPDADGRPLEAVSIASIYKQHFSSTSDVVSQSLSMVDVSIDFGKLNSVSPTGVIHFQQSFLTFIFSCFRSVPGTSLFSFRLTWLEMTSVWPEKSPQMGNPCWDQPVHSKCPSW